MAEEDALPENYRPLINRASMEAALEVAALPVYANRFELLPPPVPLDNHHVLAIGGLVAGLRGSSAETAEFFTNAKIHGAYLLNRSLAADIAVKLQETFDLTDQDLREAKIRNNIQTNK